MTEKPRETQAESYVVELKEKVNNSSLMKHPMFVGGSASRYITTRQDPTQKRVRVLCLPPRERDGIVGKSHGWIHANEVMSARILETNL